MQIILFEYSWISMKLLERNEKCGKFKAVYLQNYSYLY